jgi:uncharacterized protein (TIGR02118 family)
VNPDSPTDLEAPSIGISPTDDAGPLRQVASGFIALFFVRKRRDLDFATFRRYQLETHVPLVLKLPGLLEYRLTLFSRSDDGEDFVDGIAQLTFDSSAAYEHAMASDAGKAALDDLPNMLDTDSVMVLTAQAEDTFLAALDTTC